MRARILSVGTSRYGVQMAVWPWGLALHWEWKGETYGGSWAL